MVNRLTEKGLHFLIKTNMLTQKNFTQSDPWLVVVCIRLSTTVSLLTSLNFSFFSLNIYTLC